MRSSRWVTAAVAAGFVAASALLATGAGAATSAAAGSRTPAVSRTAAVSRAPAVSLPHAAPTPKGVTVRVISNIHFDTIDNVTGPGTGTHCDVVADLYIPSTASARQPAPAILTTNGFGGSKNDQAYIGEQFGRRGYVVLSYTGLGFGPDLTSPSLKTEPSGCKIELDSPQWDGQAGDQLLQFLGGRTGLAFQHYSNGKYSDPIPPPPVALDPRPGIPYRPLAGMIGGSYGGEVQYAVEDVGHRLDTIVPIITWNDLSYSLAPDDTSFERTKLNPAAVTYATPGIEKFDWLSLFVAEGVGDGVLGVAAQPTRLAGCPNFAGPACTAAIQLDLLGYPDAATLSLARGDSVSSYINAITIPTLLIQGQADSLFNLQEAVATYQELKARKVPVQMVWQSWGHSELTPAPGELDESPSADALDSYEGTLIAAWFDKYLKHDKSASTGEGFQYYQDWKPSPTSGPDTDQYAAAPSYPVVNAPTTFHLSGNTALVPAGSTVAAGKASFLVSAVPTSYSEVSGVQSDLPTGLTTPFDTPGTFASFETAPLSATVDQVGSAELTVRLSAPTYAATQVAGAAGQLALFAKIYDVSPTGTKTLVHRLIAPFRVANIKAAVHVELPAVVHRYLAGDRIELVIAAGDTAYRDDDLPAVVSVVNNPAAPNTLTLPLLPAAGSAPVVAAQLVASSTGVGHVQSSAAAAGSSVNRSPTARRGSSPGTGSTPAARAPATASAKQSATPPHPAATTRAQATSSGLPLVVVLAALLVLGLGLGTGLRWFRPWERRTSR